LPAQDPFHAGKISYAYFMGRIADTSEPLMSDRLVDTLPKSPGQPIFSATGKPPGSNHEKLGGNFLFADGRVEASPPRARFALTVTQSVVILNPKP
jgi:prepilin-type processing-associated H-X9-DG protein